MDKNAIKKYAVWARNELIARVTQKAQQYGITANEIVDPNADTINGKLLSDIEKKQRQALIEKINSSRFELVMEEVAYTWFNRFTSLRFMEVNGYLPSLTRVFTNDRNEFKPQILADAINLELDGLDREIVFELKDANKDEELYKYLLILQCNSLNAILPKIFQKIADYTELLMPDNLLREGSVLEQMVSMIAENDWTDQVQIIGWLYQYYNIEPKDNAFAGLKKKKKISKDTLPAATQLFTPDWIVRYMVDNSLGKMWCDSHNNGNNLFEAELDYYLKEAEQSDSVKLTIEGINQESVNMQPEDIRCIDPCSGSGHVLCYMFDVLVKIYESYGYSSRDAASLIVKNNIWGLDVDERAAQLAYFSTMMKARQYDRRFFSRGTQPNVFAIIESNNISRAGIDELCGNDSVLKNAINTVVKEMIDAREYGSLTTVSEQDWDYIIRKLDDDSGEASLFEYQAKMELRPLIMVARALAQKYHVVVTNPPYMATSNGDDKLNEFVKTYYPNSKADLYAVFIERCMAMSKRNGYVAMITQHSWMFLSTYEKLRDAVVQKDIISMAHLGARAFEEIAGEVVQTTAFVRRNSHVDGYIARYKRLVDENSQEEKAKAFLNKEDNLYECNSDCFDSIPGAPIAYWAGEGISKAFKNGVALGKISVARNGMKTGDNGRFLRLWWEVDYARLNHSAKNSDEAIKSGAKWFPYNKGGEARKWYGNNDFVVNWEFSGKEIFEDAKADERNVQDYPMDMKFTPSGTWSLINTGMPTFRYKECNLSDIAGMSFYKAGEKTKYLLGFCNTIVAANILQLLAPTINYQAGDIGRLPVLFSEEETVNSLVDENIALAKEDWDNYETSWDFKRHPLVTGDTIEETYRNWKIKREEAFAKMKANEEKLNELFLDIYDLKGAMDATVNDDSISIRLADRKQDIISFISYAVGCMFGRYSLDEMGVVCAGNTLEPNRYTKYKPDMDNIIPICDDDYFEDDIVGLFINFVRCVYGTEKLEENLKYIAESLGKKGTPRDVLRDYFLNDFYSDHCAIYSSTGAGKRPIYWLFDSGKKNGFKCLVYVHRFQEDTIARVRTDYVHEQQSRYRTVLADLEKQVGFANSSEKVKLSKRIKSLQDQIEEIRVFEEKIHHLADQMISIDLDEGIKSNYAIFEEVLAKIK